MSMEHYAGRSLITLRVNGEEREAAVWPSDVLVDVLREQLGLTGPKIAARTATAARAPSSWTAGP